MTPDECARAMQTEIQFLRAEMELNRKYIFERPLVILAGAFTAAATLKDLIGYDVLPLLFTILMAFNLWFTYNRLQSNARIVSYLQVVHTPGGELRWTGWEEALHRFRHCPPFPVAIPTGRTDRESSRFYGPILYFHLLVAVLICGFVLAQAYPSGVDFNNLSVSQCIALLLNAIGFVGFLVLVYYVRPSKVRFAIEETREVWQQIFPADPDDG